MLLDLHIDNFAIIDHLNLQFGPGLVIFTGETGAGKSILIDSLSLALGERVDAGMVRTGCEKADISAEFDIAGLPQLQSWLREQELEGDEGVCLLRRVLDVAGRSRGFINGRGATLQQMREAGEMLLDIHGQHAHQSLLHRPAQRDLLDAYGGQQPLAAAVAQAWHAWQGLVAEQSAAAGAIADRAALTGAAELPEQRRGGPGADRRGADRIGQGQ